MELLKTTWWKSNYKLPISFIIFFVLMFFLVGEQLPSVTLYLFGPSETHENKLHILDLAPGDALHRPVAYLIIGTVIWGLFRTFSWPLAYIIGTSLWTLEQLTLTTLDQRPSLQHSIIFALTFWVLLTLAPYFIYRRVDQKWGGKGIRNAMLIVLALNILLFSFFYFQIYILHRSYHNLHKNAQGQVDTTPRLPPNTCPEKLVKIEGKPIVAYLKGRALDVAAAEQKWVEANCPGALEHP